MNKLSARLLALGAIFSLSAAPVLAADATPAAPATPAAEAQPTQSGPEPVPGKDGDRIVCKSVEVTGTRFGKRLCDKKSAWEARTKVDREATDDLQRSVLTACIPTAEGLCGN